MISHNDTIAAPATGPGALAIIRVSGNKTFPIVSSIFFSKKNKPVDLSEKQPNTIHFGLIKDGDDVVDEVLVSLFRAPHSYTGEDTIEISCHGSAYIQKKILEILIWRGLRIAEPGEFTMRAFISGKMDLSQAEAVADLISSNAASNHRVAMKQMREGFTSDLQILRDELIHFASMLELELDFSEEDVEFADRPQLKDLINKILKKVTSLAASFSRGNVIKNGVPVTIAGRPNAGKSTLLNALLNEDRAIVSEIAGTTRDTIEDEIVINEMVFRLTDTAGIRATTDNVEHQGVERTMKKLSEAKIIISLFDTTNLSPAEFEEDSKQIKKNISDDSILLIVGNKADAAGFSADQWKKNENIIFISAKAKNIQPLLDKLSNIAEELKGKDEDIIITNTRHYESLMQTADALRSALHGLETCLSSDLIAMNVRQSIYYLGLITGQISTEDLLGNIFSKFCIGK